MSVGTASDEPARPTQAVIFCGGRGERLRPLTDGVPKPMAPVLGRPFLEYLLQQLHAAGIRRVLLLTGYLSEQVAAHFGRGERFGVEIQCVPTEPTWETGRRLADACRLLDERFVLLYGDNLAPFQLDLLWKHHRQAARAVTVTVSAKSQGNIRLDGRGGVEVYDSSRRQPGLSHVEIGYMVVERDPVLRLDPAAGSFSRVLAQLAGSGQVAAFDPGWHYYSISDLDRLRDMETCLRPRRLLLVDRDGVLNRKAPRGEYIWRQDHFLWIEENVAALERLAAQGFEFILLSNQAGVARGVMTLAEVEQLHRWMVGELAQRSIRVLDVLVCPHHWDEKCPCRKPRAGLFFEASRRHRFFLERTLYVGDDDRDVLASQNAGCGCVLVRADNESPKPDQPVPALRAEHLGQAVPWIVERFRGWEATHASAADGSGCGEGNR